MWQAQHSGAGVVLKYQLDTGSDQLPCQNPGAAAFEGHMAFCRYLATHTLAIDVWDADSLLQVCKRDSIGLQHFVFGPRQAYDEHKLKLFPILTTHVLSLR
jgi:hypothetical protein